MTTLTSKESSHREQNLIEISSIEPKYIDILKEITWEYSLTVSEILELSALQISKNFSQYADVINLIKKTNITDEYFNNFSQREYISFENIDFMTIRHFLSENSQKEVRIFHKFWDGSVKDFTDFLQKKYPWLKEKICIQILTKVKKWVIHSSQELEQACQWKVINCSQAKTIKEENNLFSLLTFEQLKEKLSLFFKTHSPSRDLKTLFWLKFEVFVRNFYFITLHWAKEKENILISSSIKMFFLIYNNQIHSYEECLKIWDEEIDLVKSNEKRPPLFAIKDYEEYFKNTDFETFRSDIFHISYLPIWKNIWNDYSFHDFIITYIQYFILKNVKISFNKIISRQILKHLIVSKKIFEFSSYETFNEYLKQEVEKKSEEIR